MGILFLVVGGLAMFLYGIRLMSDGLQMIAGDRLRRILEKGTRTPLRGVLTGIIVTCLIQSSSGTSVIAVGLVNAKLLTLKQAIGIIMGANIGTTLTAYLIGISLTDYALPIIFVGVLLYMFAKKQRINYIGQAILGFGLLFYGMDVMGDGLKPLAYTDTFTQLMGQVDNNSLIGVLIGVGLTAIVQSSAATIGVLQELAFQGVITYNQAIPILFGDNIGTTVTAVLAGFGASTDAKRASLVNLIIKVLGTVVFLPLFLCGILPFIVEHFTNLVFFFAGGWDGINVKMQIAQTHGVFNILNTALQLPFVALLASIVTKLIPDKKDAVKVEEEALYRPLYLEPLLLNNPPVALANATRELLHMGDLAKNSLGHARNYFFEHDDTDKFDASHMEAAIDSLELDITNYVIEATFKKDLNSSLSNRSYIILQTVGDLERIGDHAENIVEQADYCTENNINLSGNAQESLKTMFSYVQQILSDSMEALRTGDKDLAKDVIDFDDMIDQMEVCLRKDHIERLNAGRCSGSAGAVYLDVISNLERIGDHAVNIAKYVLE